jgi:hypothetical protein
VLVEPGGLEGDAGDRLGERVEEQQVGLEPAALVDDEGLPLPLAPEQRAAAPFALGGQLGTPSGAAVLLDDAAAGPAGPVEVGPAIAEFQGHRQTPDGGGTCGRTPGGAAGGGGRIIS